MNLNDQMLEDIDDVLSQANCRGDEVSDAMIVKCLRGSMRAAYWPTSRRRWRLTRDFELELADALAVRGYGVEVRRHGAGSTKVIKAPVERAWAVVVWNDEHGILSNSWALGREEATQLAERCGRLRLGTHLEVVRIGEEHERLGLLSPWRLGRGRRPDEFFAAVRLDHGAVS